MKLVPCINCLGQERKSVMLCPICFGRGTVPTGAVQLICDELVSVALALYAAHAGRYTPDQQRQICAAALDLFKRLNIWEGGEEPETN